MKCKLRILSPVHIGCGESYNSATFLLDKRKKPVLVSILDEHALFSVFNEMHLRKYICWIEKERFPNLFNFLRKELNDRNFFLQNQLQKKALYTIQSFTGEEKLQDINVFIKQTSNPYIPGTEIKGAVRTAIIYCTFIEDQWIRKWFASAVDKMLLETTDNKKKKETYLDYVNLVRNKTDPENWRKKELVKRMRKITSTLEDKILNSKPNDAKYDLMKFLQISDSDLMDPDSLAISYSKLFNPSKKPVFYEYLIRNKEVKINCFQTNANFIKKQQLDRMGFSERQKTLLSSLTKIFDCCYRFTDDLIQEEIEYFEEHHKMEIVKQLQHIASLNTPESPVLRIGKDEGYNSVTIGLALKKTLPELYDKVLIHATKGKSYDAEHGGPFPKSRKIVHWNGEELTAGWVQLIPVEDHNEQKTENIHDKSTSQKANIFIEPDLSELKIKYKS